MSDEAPTSWFLVAVACDGDQPFAKIDDLTAHEIDTLVEALREDKLTSCPIYPARQSELTLVERLRFTRLVSTPPLYLRERLKFTNQLAEPIECLVYIPELQKRANVYAEELRLLRMRSEGAEAYIAVIRENRVRQSLGDTNSAEHSMPAPRERVRGMDKTTVDDSALVTRTPGDVAPSSANKAADQNSPEDEHWVRADEIKGPDGRVVPRPTVQRWEQSDPPQRRRDEESSAILLPISWVQKRLARYRPRKKA